MITGKREIYRANIVVKKCLALKKLKSPGLRNKLAVTEMPANNLDKLPGLCPESRRQFGLHENSLISASMLLKLVQALFGKLGQLGGEVTGVDGALKGFRRIGQFVFGLE